MTLHVGNCADTLHIVVRQEGQGDDELIASIHLHKDLTPHIIENIAIYGQADRTQVAAIMQADEFLYQYEPPNAELLRHAIEDAAGPEEWVTMLEDNGRQYAAVVPRRIAAAGQGALEALWEASIDRPSEDEERIPWEQVQAELRELDIAQGIDTGAPIPESDREEYDDVEYFPLTTPDDKLADLPRIADEHTVIIYITNDKGRSIATPEPPLPSQATLQSPGAPNNQTDNALLGFFCCLVAHCQQFSVVIT